MDFWNFVKNAATGGDELYIDGEIASEESWWYDVVTPKVFRRQLAKVHDVTVYINSPGGDVFAGAEIYTALREHPGRVTVKVSGIAASAASLIAMAGDEVLMSPVAYMMIHDPWTRAVGNARDMEHAAEVLREVGEGLITAYMTKTGKTRDEIMGLLAAETYMSAQTAVDEGFADGILYEEAEAAQPQRARMQLRNHGLDAVCAMIRDRERPPAPDPDPNPAPDPDRALRQSIADRARFLSEVYQSTEI